MNPTHWTDDEILEALYGLRPEDAHLRNCMDCHERWQNAVEQRRWVAKGQTVPVELLIAQRSRIYDRVESRGFGLGVRLSPALAAVAVVVMGLFVSAPQPKADPAVSPMSAKSDAQFFSEISSMVDSAEPRAAAPIRNLFQEQ
jgi:hypothetical protein